MVNLIEILINTAFIATIYFLLSVGYSVIYGLLRIVHYVHVEIGLFGVFIFISLNNILPPFFAIILSLIITILLGIITYYSYQPFIKRNFNTLYPLIISVAISIIIQHVLLLFYGDRPYTLTINNFFENNMNVNRKELNSLQEYSIILGILIFFSLSIIIKRTKFGRHIRAISQDKELSEVFGINSKKIIIIVFVIFTVLCYLGILLVGLNTGIFAKSGTLLIIKSFTISIVAGLGNITGVFIISYLISLFEKLIGIYISSSLKDILVFILLFVALLLKPKGIFTKS